MDFSKFTISLRYMWAQVIITLKYEYLCYSKEDNANTSLYSSCFFRYFEVNQHGG